jgi:hypothetical protein
VTPPPLSTGTVVTVERAAIRYVSHLDTIVGDPSHGGAHETVRLHDGTSADIYHDKPTSDDAIVVAAVSPRQDVTDLPAATCLNHPLVRWLHAHLPDNVTIIIVAPLTLDRIDVFTTPHPPTVTQDPTPENKIAAYTCLIRAAEAPQDLITQFATSTDPLAEIAASQEVLHATER